MPANTLQCQEKGLACEATIGHLDTRTFLWDGQRLALPATPRSMIQLLHEPSHLAAQYLLNQYINAWKQPNDCQRSTQQPTDAFLAGDPDGNDHGEGEDGVGDVTPNRE